MDNWQAYKRAAVKVVQPRHTSVIFTLQFNDFMDVMLIKMKGLFADINILHYEIVFIHIFSIIYTSVLVCSVFG